MKRRQELSLKKPIDFEAVFKKSVDTFATGSGHISGLGEYVGRTAIVIILPKGEK